MFIFEFVQRTVSRQTYRGDCTGSITMEVGYRSLDDIGILRVFCSPPYSYSVVVMIRTQFRDNKLQETHLESSNLYLD